MADNLTIYNAVRFVPEEAKRKFSNGRFSGTDINPMWRIKTLTEQFGPCGIGWYTVEKRKWLESGAGEEIAAFVDIDLFVKIDGEWSKAIPGTGGSMFISEEKNGLYTDDDAYKKAYTDAISVACKALGIGADVYWEKDKTKYDSRGNGDDNGSPAPKKPSFPDGQDPKLNSISSTEQFVGRNMAGESGTPQTSKGEPLPQSRTSKVQALINGTSYGMVDVIRLIDQKFPGGKGIESITEEQFDTVMKIIGRAVNAEKAGR